MTVFVLCVVVFVDDAFLLLLLQVVIFVVADFFNVATYVKN